MKQKTYPRALEPVTMCASLNARGWLGGCVIFAQSWINIRQRLVLYTMRVAASRLGSFGGRWEGSGRMRIFIRTLATISLGALGIGMMFLGVGGNLLRIQHSGLSCPSQGVCGWSLIGTSLLLGVASVVFSLLTSVVATLHSALTRRWSWFARLFAFAVASIIGLTIYWRLRGISGYPPLGPLDPIAPLVLIVGILLLVFALVFAPVLALRYTRAAAWQSQPAPAPIGNATL